MSVVWIVGAMVFYFRWERKESPSLEHYPPFTVIVPAHNEEANIATTIENLKDLDYPDYETIIVDDGSTDGSPKIIDELVEKYPDWLKAIHITPNSGKANATNAAVLMAKGHFILVIDADALIAKDALKQMAWHFIYLPRVGAVTGNPRVINRSTLLGKIQVGEYSSIIGLIKRSQRILGKVLTVSGVIAAYRKSALFEVDFFDSKMITEDIDVSWKLQKNFWDIRYEPKALCWVLVPETVAGLLKQRIRWAQGGVEVLKKHFRIWSDYRQRRLWPVFVEYIMGVFWAFSLLWLVLTYMFSLVFTYAMSGWQFESISVMGFPLLPGKTGSILALACIFQAFVSIGIDMRYEEKGSLKYYFWAIWYPFMYWIIGAVSIIAGVINVFILKRSGKTAKWTSPDRGIHSLK